MKKQRIELRLYLALGETESGEIKMLDYFFDSGKLHGQDFKGVTGSSFYFVSPEEIEERNDLDNVKDSYGYLWQEAVRADQTELGLDEYIQELIDSEINYGDGVFFSHDSSYLTQLADDKKFMEFAENKYCDNKRLRDLWDSEVGTFECVGGGRCFDAEEDDMTFYISPEREELHAVARRYEAGEMSIDEVEAFLIKTNIPFKKVER